ncbi:MAG TPA: T9SS type A sorting domain-containing protein, partial [Bacteroidota bacterium]|nr:T9SS type A sorting domain-containing protein [Bacteroidota bacterium]
TAPFARLNPDTCVVTFRVDLASAINKGGYSVGDTVQVQSGFFGTGAVNAKTKNLIQVIGSKYQVIDTIVTKVGAILDYQYYTVKFGQTNRENYYNFTYSGPTQSEAERRQFTVPSKNFIITDYDTSVISARREPVFPSVRVLARKVRVTYTVDLRPALYQVVLHNDTLDAIQGTTVVTRAVKDSIFKWGVWINGLAVGGWGNPNGSDWGFDLVNNPIKKMYDDGTHGDKVAHDSIYSMQIVDSPDSLNLGTRNVVGQVFKFGIYGSDNEGGRGGYGNNHGENIVDTDTSYTIASDFGSINPKFYSAWNYDLHKPILTSVQPLPGVVKAFALEQNYPNPFNPSTTIEFSIPLTAQVQLRVYNILGQEVATLVNETLKVGRHSVTFDASRLATGIYMYKITAGNFVSTKKMLLLK